MSGPLAGLTVIELAGLGPGPFCGMILADLGAQVTRIDRPGLPGPGAGGEKDFLRRGRRSILIDLKHPAGPGLVGELAASADVLLEGFRPGVMERLGLGPGPLLAAVPSLIYARLTGWGQSGPLAQGPGRRCRLGGRGLAAHDRGALAPRGRHLEGRSGHQPVRLSRTPAAVPAPTPRPGEHTDAVLRSCGLSPLRVRSLRAAGVVS